MSTKIIEFWKNNRVYWITPPSKQKEVDKLISDTFWNYPVADENLIGRIIYFDQFYRHFCRHSLITEDDVTEQRQNICEVIKAYWKSLKDFDEVEIIFAMMPFKHLKQYDFIFDYLHNQWLPADKKIIDFPDLQKFYIDTYKKAFRLDTVRENLITEHSLEPYDASLICDYYPEKYNNSSWSLEGAVDNKLLPLLKPERKVLVSLSGGVDSMVMLSLLKYNGADVSAVHIVYGNRKESEHEYRLLAEFCVRLSVPLFVYRIKWLRRGEVDRQFYEDMTRDLRFATYHAAAEVINSPEPCVMMGHIKDDVVENIWTNIAHCHHLGNLKKMESEEVQLGVRIMRPLLTVDKADIYQVSEEIGIPYFKNTTPSWSNRGKFREHFHAATVAQYGAGIDAKVIEFAEAIQAQNKLLNMLLYDPIYNSFKDNKVDVTTAVKANLDANSWLGIFEHICHKYLGRARPSIKCVRDFASRVSKWSWDKLNVEMGKGFKVQMIQTREGKYIMEFILI
jgi:tRNA(Ile)-lysidine synthetase-like protein